MKQNSSFRDTVLWALVWVWVAIGVVSFVIAVTLAFRMMGL